jgi:SPP1 family predicted phage head-tail adaptor
MLSIGQLDRRIEIFKPTYVKDAYGQSIKTYVSLISCWAHIDWKTSRRKEESQENVQGTDVVFYIRKLGFASGIIIEMGTYRIEYDSNTYIIHGIKEIDGREKFLEIETKLKDNN